jgi:uncharacterized membrane protein
MECEATVMILNVMIAVLCRKEYRLVKINGSRNVGF